jgi:hypothetical protein
VIKVDVLERIFTYNGARLPESHVELLPVRESKKERAAFDALIAQGKLSHDSEADDGSSDLAIA